MKTRLAFVSNSSSTSFTLTMKREELEDVIKGLPETTQRLIAMRLRPEYGTLFGFNISTLQGTCSGESVDPDDDGGITLEEIMSKIHTIAESRKMESLFSSEQC